MTDERPFPDVWAWGQDAHELRRECGRAFAHHPHDTILGRCAGRREHADPKYRTARKDAAQ